MDKLLDRKFLFFQKDVNRTWPDSVDVKEDLISIGTGIVKNAQNIDYKFKTYIKHEQLLQVAELTEELGDIFFYMIKLMDVFKISLTDVMNNNIAKRKYKIKEDFRYKSYLKVNTIK